MEHINIDNIITYINKYNDTFTLIIIIQFKNNRIIKLQFL